MKPFLFILFTTVTFFCWAQVMPDPEKRWSEMEANNRIPITFTGGYETDPRDHGRPVILVAAALNVPSDVFRQAFSSVHPAPAGETPQPEQVRKNKQALLDVLAPYGVTNDRLDEVSNFYRYQPGSGTIWKHADAQGYFVLGENGQAGKVVLTYPGYGYSSPPNVILQGKKMNCEVRLNFSTDLQKNGSIKDVALVFAPTVSYPASGKSE